jgi:hypothetical protein
MSVNVTRHKWDVSDPCFRSRYIGPLDQPIGLIYLMSLGLHLKIGITYERDAEGRRRELGASSIITSVTGIFAEEQAIHRLFAPLRIPSKQRNPQNPHDHRYRTELFEDSALIRKWFRMAARARRKHPLAQLPVLEYPSALYGEVRQLWSVPSAR